MHLSNFEANRVVRADSFKRQKSDLAYSQYLARYNTLASSNVSKPSSPLNKTLREEDECDGGQSDQLRATQSLSGVLGRKNLLVSDFDFFGIFHVFKARDDAKWGF